jgi:hypothetical protein
MLREPGKARPAVPKRQGLGDDAGRGRWLREKLRAMLRGFGHALVWGGITLEFSVRSMRFGVARGDCEMHFFF